MEQRFLDQDTIIRIINIDEGTLHKQLPPGLYTVAFAQAFGYHLVKTENKLKIPKKIYGDAEKSADRIIKTYKDRDVSTGVLLTGDKGAGKTLLSSIISSKMLAEGIPVVMVNSAFTGADFIDFINNIGNCVILFDEFCKVYNTRGSDEEGSTESTILTILDGVNKQKRLAILIENSIWRVSDYLLNRPGRLFYHFEYKKIGKDVVEDYCNSRKVPNKVLEDILLLRNNIRSFNFDMMKALIEEYERYGGSVKDHANVLNIQLSGDSSISKYNILKVIRNSDKKEMDIIHNVMQCSDEEPYFYVHFQRKKSKKMKKLPDNATPDEIEDFLSTMDAETASGVTSTTFQERDIKLEEGDITVLDNGEYTAIVQKVAKKLEQYGNYVPSIS